MLVLFILTCANEILVQTNHTEGNQNYLIFSSQMIYLTIFFTTVEQIFYIFCDVPVNYELFMQVKILFLCLIFIVCLRM